MNKIKVILIILLIALIGIGIFGMINKKENNVKKQNNNNNTTEEIIKIKRGTYEYNNKMTNKFNDFTITLKFFEYSDNKNCYNEYYDIYFNDELISSLDPFAITYNDNECLNKENNKIEAFKSEIYNKIIKNKDISAIKTDKNYIFIPLYSKTKNGIDTYLMITNSEKMLKIIKITDGEKNIISLTGCDENRYKESSYYLDNENFNIYYLKVTSDNTVEEHKIIINNDEITDSVSNTCDAVIN